MPFAPVAADQSVGVAREHTAPLPFHLVRGCCHLARLEGRLHLLGRGIGNDFVEGAVVLSPQAFGHSRRVALLDGAQGQEARFGHLLVLAAQAVDD